MLRDVIILGFVLLGPLPGQMCTGRKLWGPYGMQLSGITAISGTQAPVADLALLTLSYDGAVSGSSSVNFNGLLLGNPVTGTYELQPDCTVLIGLQDDSGAFQHFRGTATQEGDRIDIRQTDPGTGERGIMKKAPNRCTEADIRGAYSFTLSGTATTLATGGAPQPIAIAGTIRLDPNRKLTLVRPAAGPATLEVQSDCIVQFEFPSLSTAGRPLHLRGILVNGGAEILAIQTDPGEPAAAVFVARGQQ